MGSRKRRRERDDGRKHRRHSHSRSDSENSRSRSRSPLVAPPPPSLSSSSSRREKSDRNEREHDDDRDRRHRKSSSSKDHKRKHYHREKSPSGGKRSSDHHRPSTSKREPEYHSDSSDVVEVPLAPPAPIISKKAKESSPIPENGAGDSLSIVETNKLRAKLGLKPLEVDSDKKASSSSKPKADAEGNQLRKDEWGEFYHKPAKNTAEKLQAEKLREKFRQNKEKRALETKMKSTKTLGEEDEEGDDVSNWVQKNRQKEKLKEEAARRAKLLEEMDDQFGVGDLVQQETRREQKKLYSTSNLKGLRVDHDVDQFTEGKTVILTLKDQEVLDEENGDTLVNVNMIDDERYRKNIDNKKLNPNQYGYNVYDEEVDAFGDPVQRNILSKYDEEIKGATKKPSFTIGQNVEEEIAQRRKLLEIKTKLSGKVLETLNEQLTTLASDTYSEAELATFKKPKKKIKKLRKKLKAEDLEPLPGDVDSSKDLRKRDPSRHLSDVLDTDDVPASMPFETDIKIEEEGNELEHILSKARRLKQSEALISKSLNMDTAKIKPEIKSERNSDDEDMDEQKDFITLNATAEFCRTLGDIPTYGMSGNREVDPNDMMDFESDGDDAVDAMEEERTTGTWNSVNPTDVVIDVDKPSELTEVAILDEEPDVASGMGAALKLALSKGYLEKEESNRPSNTRMAHLQAQNYSIEDKAHGEDDKFNRRDRFHAGPINDFKEKDNYKPNVKLEYIDDSGRLLNEKEAFRYLSHKFHGKGPGKNKIEKRLKKSEQDGLMMKMSSTDTPLGTLTMLQHKQKETHSPYIVLSGSKQMQGTTSITKHK